MLFLLALAQQIDPNVPVRIPVQDLTNWLGILTRVLADILTPATSPLLANGRQLWEWLAAIVVVWSGLKIAYSGTFEPWQLVRLVVALWIPWFMLRYYDTPIPLTAHSFPQTILAGANSITAHFSSNVVDLMQDKLTTLIDTYQARFTAAWSSMSVLRLLSAGSSALFTLLGSIAALAVMILALILIFAISMAQVVWATIAIAILIFLGPIFIPWILIEPMAFLFWGWFRALLVYSLYSVIAGALLRVWGGIAIGYVDTLSNTGLDFDSLGWLSIWVVALLPLLVASILSALKVGELASALVSGSGAGGSGFLGLVGAAAGVAVGGRLARVGAKGAGG